MPTAATNRTSTTPRPQPETPSVPFLARACDTPIVGLRAKAVFVAMARRQRTPEGSCFASDGTLAKLAGCDSRTVRRGRSDLDRMGRIEFIGWRYHGEHSRTKEWRVIPVETDSLSVPATSKRTDSPAGTDRLSDNVRREEKIKSKSAAARDPERLTCGECGNTWPAKFGAECFSCKKAKKADPAVTRRHREQMGPTYERLHTAGIEAAETAVWSDCGDCGSTVLADMTRCPTCGSTTINARPVVGLAREDAMQTNQKPAPAPRLPAVPAVPAAVPAPPIVDPPFDPREAFTPQPKPTPVMPPDPEYADVLAAYQCIREAPLTDLERSALAELPPADTLSWLAQADGAEGLRGAA